MKRVTLLPTHFRKKTRKWMGHPDSILVAGSICGDSIGQGKSMSMTLTQFAPPFAFDRLQQMVVVNGAIGRLLVACGWSGRSIARPPVCAPIC
jgi:hypothetical protein